MAGWNKKQSIEDEDDDEEEDDNDDDEYEYYYEDENNNEVIVGYSLLSSLSANSLEQLLVDAKRMCAQETEMNKLLSSVSSSLEQEGSFTIQNILSTIVTADFFVVCALLLWFLTVSFVPMYSRMITYKLCLMVSSFFQHFNIFNNNKWKYKHFLYML